MRLSKQIINDFVDEVMAAIPRKNKYNKNDAEEQIRHAVEAQMPEEILAFAKKFPNLVRRDKYMSIEPLTYFWTASNGNSRKSTPSIRTFDHEAAKMVDVREWVKQKEAYEKEEEERKQKRSRLLEVASSCSTLKQLEAALPALKSYMPAERVEKKLPVAAGGLVSDLLASGLKVPKDEQ